METSEGRCREARHWLARKPAFHHRVNTDARQVVVRCADQQLFLSHEISHPEAASEYGPQ